MDGNFQNGVDYAPGKKVLTYFIVSKLLTTIFIFVVLGAGLTFIGGIPGKIYFYLILAGVIFCALVIGVAWLRYISVKFMLDEFSFHVEKGIINKAEIGIPYRQIQNVNHRQSLTQKMWGISHVTIQTAGTDGPSNATSEGILPLLDSTLAEKLERELMRRASNV